MSGGYSRADLCFEGDDEAGAFGEFGVDGDVAVHLHGHLAADGEAEAVALGEVVELEEGFEDVLTLFLGDEVADVGDDELVLVCAALLEFEAYVSVLGGRISRRCGGGARGCG